MWSIINHCAAEEKLNEDENLFLWHNKTRIPPQTWSDDMNENKFEKFSHLKTLRKCVDKTFTHAEQARVEEELNFCD